jgi:putative membrane protein
MRMLLTCACAIALVAFGAPTVAQDMASSGSGTAPGGTMSAGAVGAAPMTGTPSTSYVAWAADSDMYEIQSSKLALAKGKSAEVKTMARELIADHTTTSKTLMAALPKTQPKVPKPPMKLSADNAAMIAQLRQAPADGFDALYLQQQLTAHQKAWSLHAGYATDGTDPALKQVATSAVPIIEKHLQHLKTMPGAAGQ